MAIHRSKDIMGKFLLETLSTTCRSSNDKKRVSHRKGLGILTVTILGLLVLTFVTELPLQPAQAVSVVNDSPEAATDSYCCKGHRQESDLHQSAASTLDSHSELEPTSVGDDNIDRGISPDNGHTRKENSNRENIETRHISLNEVIEAVEVFLVAKRPANRDRLADFLRIQSVSSDPFRSAAVRHAAEWLVQQLVDAGLENVVALPTSPLSSFESTNLTFLSDNRETVTSQTRPDQHVNEGSQQETDRTHTADRPVVYADWLHADDPDAPTILIYGHYDVQPEDPVDLWTSPPFEPEIRNGNLYARGASDDKGHVMSPILAVEAWLKTYRKLPVNVKLLIEGEEEVGSPNLLRFLKAHRERLLADYIFSADGGQISPEQPGLCLGLRGSVAFQVDVFSGRCDGHSGTFGGGVQNPLHALADILSSMHDRSDGRILIPGFYDDVVPLSDEERFDMDRFSLIRSESDMLSTIGVSESFGEDGFSFFERTWARPSLEIVGMWGGYTGEGIKTVLPAVAHAKISSRLAYAQDPDKAAAQIEDHIRNVSSKIPGIRVQVTRETFTAKPYRTSKYGVGSRAASTVLRGLYGKEPAYFYMGGSIPATAYLKDVIGVDTVMFAFGHSDENVHAPDEFARLSSLDRGEVAYARLFLVLARDHALNVANSRGTCPVDADGSSTGLCSEMFHE